MKRILFILLLLITTNPAFAGINFSEKLNDYAISKLIKSQANYATHANLKKFVNTYDENYKNNDGLNLEEYAKLCNEVWNSYKDVKYTVKIKNITYTDKDKATVEVVETCTGVVDKKAVLNGDLTSVSNSVYYLQKNNGKWKVVSDSVLDEKTSMLYGLAKDLDIKFTAPENVKANTEYSAKVEFVPPKDVMAIVSINADKVSFPQEKSKEVYRTFPEDNELERLFTANNENKNEYVIASIGLTKSSVSEINVSLSLVGMAFSIRRVNVITNDKKEQPKGENVKD